MTVVAVGIPEEICMYFDEWAGSSAELDDKGVDGGEGETGFGDGESSLERLGMALERCG